jgi:hypothetical protein
MMAMWMKCRQVPPPFFSNLLESSPAVRKRRKKISTEAVILGQQMRMFHLPFHFVRDPDQLQARLFCSSSSAVPAAEKLKH